MKTNMVRKSWFALFLLVLMSLALNPARAGDDDEKAVKAAAAQFYSALNAAFTGDGAPMKEIWSHAKDITFMGPAGEYLVGWKAIGEDWDQTAAMKLGGEIKPKDMHLNVGKDIAVVQNYEVGENTNIMGKTVKVSIRVTSTFRKENGQWRMIGHHTDHIPNL